MLKEIKIYDGDCIAKYEETDEKKQQLWDAFIKWCKDGNHTCSEDFQCDSFVLNAPEFMCDVLDNIVQFKVEEVD